MGMCATALTLPFAHAARARGVSVEVPDVPAIASGTAHDLLARAAADLRDPWLGLRVARTMWAVSDPRVNAMMLTAPSIRAVGELMVRGKSALETDLPCSVTDEGSMVAFRMGQAADNDGEVQLMLCALAGICYVTLAMHGCTEGPKVVVRTRTGPTRSAPLPFDVLASGDETCVLIPKRLAYARPRSANDALFAFHASGFLARAAAGPLEPPVVRAVREVLASHGLGLDVVGVADALRVATRTLQRKLAAVHTSVEAVREEERRARVVSLLRTHDATATSRALGYTDVTAFHRAFRTWTGTTTRELRENMSEMWQRFERNLEGSDSR